MITMTLPSVLAQNYWQSIFLQGNVLLFYIETLNKQEAVLITTVAKKSISGFYSYLQCF